MHLAWLFAIRVTEATVDTTKHSLEPDLELTDRQRMWRIMTHLQRTSDVAHVSIVETVVELCSLCSWLANLAWSRTAGAIISREPRYFPQIL
jgi:hypothetical protein